MAYWRHIDVIDNDQAAQVTQAQLTSNLIGRAWFAFNDNWTQAGTAPPLSFPVLASFAIFQFLWVWNDLLVAMVFLGTEGDQIVLTAKLNALLGSRGGDWEILTTSAFITIIVPLTVFFSLQRYFVRGLLAGSVKGG
jgi:hypothetical protein